MLRLRSSADVLTAVPHLLGFRPSDSVVVVALRSPRNRIGLTQRHDLLDPEHDRMLARLLVGNALDDGAVALYVVVYPPDPVPLPAGDGGRPVLPRRRFVTELMAAATEAGLDLVDATCATTDRSWSYVCTDPACCPAEGRPVEVPAGSAVDTAFVLEGSAPLASREQLVASLQPAVPEGMDRLVDAAALALSRAAARRSTRRRCSWPGRRPRLAAEGRLPDDAAAARLLVGVQHVLVRDAVVLGTSPGRRDAACLLWADLVRRCPADLVAPVATVLGWLAYLQGRGALARTALERALAAEPGYRLAGLLEALLDAAVPPAELERALRPGAEQRERSEPGGGTSRLRRPGHAQRWSCHARSQPWG